MNERLWRWDGARWVFRYSSPGQKRFVLSMAPELLFSGHWGNGKSVGHALKALSWGMKWPNNRIALVRKVYNDLKTSTLRVWQDVMPPDLWRGGLVGGENAYRLDFPNGSLVDFAGMDRPEKFLSSEYALILVDEAIELEEEDWDLASGRLRWPECPFFQIAGATNPGNPTHWIAERFDPNNGSHVDRDADGRLIRETLVAGVGDNDAHLPADYVRRRSRLTGTRRLRYDLGRWVAHEGAVFGESFDPDTHIIARPDAWDRWGGFPPPDWARYRTVDFGFTNPFVCSWYAEDPDGRLFRYREIYKTMTRTATHARAILDAEADELAALRAAVTEEDARRLGSHLSSLNVVLTVTDHDPEAQATLALHGITSVDAVKDRKAGVEAVESALVDRRLFFVRGSLVEADANIEKGPRCTEDELPGITWAKEKDTALEVGAREVPVKTRDHGYDALCYLLLTKQRAWTVYG